MAAEQQVKIILKADDRATGKIVGLTGSMRGLNKAALGVAGAYFGVRGLQSALRGTIGQAIKYESAFAGVRKTVDATEEEFKRLSDGFRQLSKEMPVTSMEFARIGELAGQLGVKSKDILKFSKTIAQIGVTTNLSLEEAATQFARFSNIMGISINDTDRLGSTVVDLGNNLATTEAEIVQMSLRLAGASRVVGLSTSDVLGLSGALSSVGIQAQMGGSAISRTMIKISQAVSEAGDKMDMFAELAGMNAEEFSTAWKTQPIEALLAFVKGLSNAQAAGEDLFGILGELEITEIRERDALLRLAGASDLVAESISLASNAWKENSALTEEAAKRFGTTASQILILKNNWDDLLITLGENFIPLLNKLIPKMITLVESWANLSDNIRWATSSLTNFISVIKELPGIKAIRKLGDVQRGLLSFQSGGVVPGPLGAPQMAVVHGGEQVVPAGGLRSSGRSGGVVINITGNTISSDLDISDLAARVGDAVMRSLKIAQPI